MSFPFNAYAAALAGSFCVTLLAMPCWQIICRKLKLVDDPGHRKIHDAPVPLAGGFGVLTGMVLPLVLGAALIQFALPHFQQAHSYLQHGLDVRQRELTAIVIGALGIVLIGWLDDTFELRPLFKFAGQFGVAALVAAAECPDHPVVHSTGFSYAITVLWVLTLINAFNFMDNMNGLCAGLGIISAWCLALISGMDGQYLVAIMALLVSGSLLGFLPYNFPKAGAFLGDTGSHLTGYLLAVMAILPHFSTRENPRPWAVLVPLLILAVPLGDLAWVVILRWRIGQPFYVGDNNHLSHRLVRKGFSKTGAVLFIWLLAAILGGTGVALMVFN